MGTPAGQQKNVDLDNAITHITQAAMILAPNGKVQASISSGLNRMRADGMISELILIQLMNMMLDGLRHGNWPA
jgi:hypothetical protein